MQGDTFGITLQDPDFFWVHFALSSWNREIEIFDFQILVNKHLGIN
jgi:hypothetical protein